MRLDQYLVEHAEVGSRHRAKLIIKAGAVKVNGDVITKPAHQVKPGDEVNIIKEVNPYVSQGGLKLAWALKTFNIDLTNHTVLDVGSSTGGFTDCALKHGAKHVLAVDVGTLQLAPSLRQDQRVTVMENTNFLAVDSTLLNLVTFAVMDVSFTSSIPLVKHLRTLKPDIPIIVLIKPQFEGAKTNKKGVVKHATIHKHVLKEYLSQLNSANIAVKDLTVSNTPGQSGNKEFLLYLTKPYQHIDDDALIDRVLNT